jgi:hypothetical protein
VTGRLRLVTAILALLLLAPPTACAALVDEQRQGQSLIHQVQAGTTGCSDLTADDLDHVGEYLMFRAVGSTALHQAMNNRMREMMGEQAETRMHERLGARYAGCSSNRVGLAGAGSMMGAGVMMTGDYGRNGFGTMMSSSDWRWMSGGAWRYMSSSQWQTLERRLLGTTTDAGTGWSPLAVVAVAVAAAGVLLLAMLAIARRSQFRPSKPAPSS